MPNYLFQHRINTIAEILESFEHNGFQFEPHKIDIVEGRQCGWIASKGITAENVNDAFRDFHTEFYPFIDKLSFVTQCFTVVDFEPYLVKRADRPEFLIRHSNERKHVPLHFGRDELESLKALDHYNPKGDAFRYLREAINAPDFYARLAMLSSALEAIAGEKKPSVTNHNYIKNKILKDKSLHERIFRGKSGIRNQLLHGKKIDDEVHGDTAYNRAIYESIINYFNSSHGTKINVKVVGAPRTVGRNYEVWRGWLNPRLDIEIDLKKFCELDLYEITKHFDIIDKPKDY